MSRSDTLGRKDQPPYPSRLKEKDVYMPKSIFKATAGLQSGTQVKVKASGFEITIDEPQESGGTDTGMNPVELVLSALGACQAICASPLLKIQN